MPSWGTSTSQMDYEPFEAANPGPCPRLFSPNLVEIAVFGEPDLERTRSKQVSPQSYRNQSRRDG
jgi:hypothetical protein